MANQDPIKDIATANQRIAELEAALSQSQQMLNLIINNFPGTVFWKNRDSVYLGGNQALAQSVGLETADQIAGKTDYDLPLTRAEADRYRANDRQVMKEGIARRKTVRLQRQAGGQAGWFETCKIPLRDDSGQMIGVLGISIDISEHKQAQEDLRRSRQMLQLILDNIPQRVFWKERTNLAYMGCNRAFAVDTGVTVEEMLGKTDYDLLPREQVDLYRPADIQVIETGRPQHYETTKAMADGSTRWIRSSKLPLRDEQDTIIGLLGLYEDITGEKEAALEKERLHREVIEAQQRAIQELSTPIIPIFKQVLVLPLVGSIDSMRARDITRNLLAGIQAHRAKVVILDVTGVPLIDSGVADHLNKTIQAARLKGARTIITGISDVIAETIVDLGIDWGDVETLASLQSGLLAAFHSLGVRLVGPGAA